MSLQTVLCNILYVNIHIGILSTNSNLTFKDIYHLANSSSKISPQSCAVKANILQEDNCSTEFIRLKYPDSHNFLVPLRP